MAKRSFVRGALWLTLTGVSLRGVGMIYRVYISSWLSESGMGLYQLILSVYMLCVSLAGAGLSIAVTSLVSLSLKNGRAATAKIMRCALTWSTVLSCGVSLVMTVGAPDIAVRFIHDGAAASSLRILAPALPFMAAAGCFNGYFLAVGRVHFSCLAQVAEQAVRIAVTVVLFSRLPHVSEEMCCAYVFLGNTVSELVAAGMLALFYSRDIRRLPSGRDTEINVFSRLLTIQLPIAFGRYVTSLLHTFENLLVPRGLTKFGGNRQIALAEFGALKAMALPLIMFPSSLLSSLSGLLVPEFNFAYSENDYKKLGKLTRHTLSVTFAFSLFMGGVFYRFGQEMGELIYHSENVGQLLRKLAPLLPFMYLDCITDGLLKGTGQQFASLRYCTFDSLLRIALVWILLPIRGMNGFLLVMTVSNVGVSMLGLRKLLKCCRCSPPINKGVVLPLVAVILAHLVTVPLPFLWAVPIYVLIFFLFSTLSGTFGLKDFKLLIKPRQ